MRSFHNKTTFFQKMKKKPAQQDVLDNLDKYTDEQIENLSGPHFPKWVREVLVELKKRNGKTSEDVAKEIAAIMIAASQIK